jgi:hypothetical protein
VLPPTRAAMFVFSGCFCFLFTMVTRAYWNTSVQLILTRNQVCLKKKENS